MKRFQVLNLVNGGVATITAHSLDSKHAYKVVQFRKAILAENEAFEKERIDLLKEAGIEDPRAFDDELVSLRKTENPSDEQKKRLDELNGKFNRFNELLTTALNEEVVLNCKTMPYDEWHKLQNENAEKEIYGKKCDLLSGQVEDLLEGVLWEAPLSD